MGHGFRDEQFWKAGKAELSFHFSGGTTAIKAWNVGREEHQLFQKNMKKDYHVATYIKSVPKIFGPGRIKVGRWNERVRAKRCDAVDWDSA